MQQQARQAQLERLARCVVLSYYAADKHYRQNYGKPTGSWARDRYESWIDALAELFGYECNADEFMARDWEKDLKEMVEAYRKNLEREGMTSDGQNTESEVRDVSVEHTKRGVSPVRPPEDVGD